MDRQVVRDALAWGIALWAIGYALGFAFYFALPPSLIGWAILPIGTVITLWVLFSKVKGNELRYYAGLAGAWTVIAIVFDYLFIVRLLSPADGYYKPDVYLYYALTILLPIIAGWWKERKGPSGHSRG